MPHDTDNDQDDLMICPECGGRMKESENDPSMLECAGCGHTMSRDDAKGADIGENE